MHYKDKNEQQKSHQNDNDGKEGIANLKNVK